MHHGNGRYRDTLVKLLEEVYLGRADYETLAELIGIDYAELDREVLRHVAAGRYD
jgi:hypothetical protein